MNKNSNPVFRNIDNSLHSGVSYVNDASTTASWKGIISKTILLVLISIASGIGSWFLPLDVVYVLLAISGIFTFLSVFIGMRFVKTARVFSIVYSVLQGVTFGTLTLIIDSALPGVGAAALSATFVIVIVMAILHSIGSVRATKKLVRFVMGSLIAIMLSSLVLFIGTLINVNFASSLTENFSLMVVVLAFMVVLGALMLVIDFDNAKMVVDSNAPKVYEWQVSFGLMVTMIWIYFQMLRLISLIVSRRD